MIFPMGPWLIILAMGWLLMYSITWGFCFQLIREGWAIVVHAQAIKMATKIVEGRIAAMVTMSKWRQMREKDSKNNTEMCSAKTPHLTTFVWRWRQIKYSRKTDFGLIWVKPIFTYHPNSNLQGIVKKLSLITFNIEFKPLVLNWLKIQKIYKLFDIQQSYYL